MPVSSPVSFQSLAEFPNNVVSNSGLHLVGAFHLLQRDAIIEQQKAKRRGGTKKAKLTFSLIDHSQRSARPVQHQLEWKTITQKNFSNRQNIMQYERNPFALMSVGQSAKPDLLVVVHGAVKPDTQTASNMLGLNVSGTACSLLQHPRFLLSSGKGEEGARSTFLVYGPRSTSVQIDRVWVEHRELKITVENLSAASETVLPLTDLPVVSFIPKFKTTYAATNESAAAAPAAAAASSSKSSSKSSTTRWVSAQELTASRTASVQATPAPAPAAVATVERTERVAKRSFSEVETVPESQPESDQQPTSLDSPKYDYIDSESSPKRKMLDTAGEELPGAHFAGFDLPLPEMGLAMSDFDNQNGWTDDAMMTQETESDAGAFTPSTDATTPTRSQTPAPSNSASDSNSFMNELEEAEQHNNFDAMQSRVRAFINQDSAMRMSDVPEALRNASVGGFKFAPVESSPSLMDLGFSMADMSPQLKAIGYHAGFHSQSPPPLFDIDCLKAITPPRSPPYTSTSAAGAPAAAAITTALSFVRHL